MQKLQAAAKRRWACWGSVAAGSIVLGALLCQVSLHDVWSVVQTFQIPVVIAGVVCGLLATPLRALRFGLVFPPRRGRIGLYAVFGLSRLLNILLPMRTGELASLTLLKRSGFVASISEAVPAWLLFRLADVAALSLWLTAAMALHTAGGPSLAVWYGLLGLTVGLFLAWSMLVRWSLTHEPVSREGWFAGRLLSLQLGFRRLDRRTRGWRSIVLALLIGGLSAAPATLALVAVDSPLRWSECLLATMLVQAVGFLPINTPLMVGTADAAWVGVLALLGVPLNQAIAIAISVRAITLLTVFLDALLAASVGLFLSPAVTSARLRPGEVASPPV